MVLHIAAFVSPAADYHPKQAMKTNYGSTQNIIRAIFELGQQDVTRLVYIGTVAETGDRMPPIHWGRVGDPIKPSMFDYYAVSKVAAERLVIESGLKHWVSLRQTGIIGKAMSEIEDAIMFHNCFDNVLEYCSDRDSARAMKNLCAFFHDGTLDESFWGHIYNIGGGESCRVSTYEMYRIMYGAIGLTKLDYMLSPKKEATRNFHGQYYLDSDKLEQYLHFRSDSMQYFYDCYLEKLGTLATVSKVLCRLPGGPDAYESEGFDRENLAMPEGHVRLIETVAAANPNTVVVLFCGGVVELPWADKVRAVLYMGLPGQAGGAAAANLLTGKANPSGKLTETWPVRYQDVPSRETFGQKTTHYL